MNTHIAGESSVRRQQPGKVRSSLKSWLATTARGRSLPIVATLVVLLLGLPDELVEILRELPCPSAAEDCCDQFAQRCTAHSPGKAVDGSQISLVTDQLRDLVTDWFFRIWTLLF